VLGKGTIEVQVSGTECLSRNPPAPVVGSETFTIAGGTGIYADAGGGGTIQHVSYGPPDWRGTDTWSGTINVPGLEFDLTRPTIRGAVNKRVRAPRGAKRIRVRYGATAQDDVDGALRALCKPKSGARFRVGRTVVRCSATDRSANTAKARFRVTVKQRGKR
jgi:hypothetical protein